MAETDTSYNFGVLTRRYELISKSAGQFAPAIAGLFVGFVALVLGVAPPITILPGIVGFWFALGKVPFGPHRGTRVRSMAMPLLRYGRLYIGGHLHWVMPTSWLGLSTTQTTGPVAEPRGGTGSGAPASGRGEKATSRAARARTHHKAPSEQLPPELGRLTWQSVTCDGSEAGLLGERM
ncbi:MAG: hypothetical protein ACYCUF_11315, partial [Acidimicrobiales bacterium]